MRFLLLPALVLLVTIVPKALPAQGAPKATNPDYLWPLDVPALLVSSFGEYRASHLHAGLDLSTGGRSGLRCYAVADGWIARMRMSPFGYGKAIYLQLDVGPLVVYAHLSRFASDLADRAWAEQLRRGGFTFDIYLQRDEIRVRRGDVIAWSGASGIGHPHLHFEVRDGDVARNAQTAGFAVRDQVTPTIRDVTVMPMTVDSYVEGAAVSYVIPAAQATTEMTPLRVSGEIGFAVRAIDRAAEGPYRQAPYVYEVRIDGDRLFRAQHERFDYAHNHHILLDYDQDRLLYDKARSMQLFTRVGNRLHGRQPDRDGRGILYAGNAMLPQPSRGEWFHVAAGNHLVEIEVADVAGNTRTVTFPIRVDAPPEIERLLARHTDSGWQAVCVARDDVGTPSLQLAWKQAADTDWQDLPGQVDAALADAWVAALPEEAGARFMLRAIATDGSGLTALRTWGSESADSLRNTSTRQAPTELAIAVDWRRTRLRLDLTSPQLLTRPPDLFLESADGTTQQLRGVRQAGERQWTWSQPLQALPQQPRRLRIVSRPFGAAPFEQQVLLPAQIVRHGEAQVVDTLLDGWELDLESTTFFEDVAVRMQPFDSNELPLGRELNATGAAVAVEAREAAVNRRIRLRYRPSTDAVVPSISTNGVSLDTPNVDNFEKNKAGLFYVDRSGNLQFMSAQRDEQGALVGRARYLTVFAVLTDTTAPRLRHFKNTTQRGKAPRLRFSVTDAGAGLDSDGLSLTIDGTLAISEWDPETTRVKVLPTQPLASGSHSLHVVAVDQLGNRREHTWTFKIP